MIVRSTPTYESWTSPINEGMQVCQWFLCQPRGTITKPGHLIHTKTKDIRRANTKLSRSWWPLISPGSSTNFLKLCWSLPRSQELTNFPCTGPNESRSCPPALVLKDLLTHYSSICAWNFSSGLFLQVSQPKLRVHFSCPTYVLTRSVRVILLHLTNTRMYFLSMYQPDFYDIMVTSFRHVSTWQCHLQEVCANLKNHID